MEMLIDESGFVTNLSMKLAPLLIQTKVNYVVQEAVVIKNLSRKCPYKYEDLDTLDELEARAIMIWFIGEKIDNADRLLESCINNYHDKNIQVQLQLLISIVNHFLKRSTDTQELRSWCSSSWQVCS